VCTIHPDGTGLRVLTSSGANDGHAVWNSDGRILYNSGMYGFREEAALYDDTFQPYGQIFAMNADGSGKKLLTDSQWEDSMPIYLPQDILSR
jgi:Tol biopolymer transport system component